MYIAEKRLNNNVVLAHKNGKQFILVGKGLGFKCYPSDAIDESKVDEVFVSSDGFRLESFAELVEESPPEQVTLVKQIISEGEQLLEKKLNPNLIVSLLDHLQCAMMRQEKNVSTSSPLDWEIRNIYPVESKIGDRFLELAKETLGIALPQSEAVFLALHFITIQFENESMQDTMEFTETMRQILSIISYHFQREIDEDSINYQRFLTHFRYYLIRQKKGEILSLGNEELYDMVRERCTEENSCVEKIAHFINGKYGYRTSNDEKLYLILHVNRLISTKSQ